MNIRKIIYLLSFFIVLSEAASVFAGEITVYSARKEHLVKPLFDAYSEKTGIKIKYLTGEEATLLHRLKAEGVNTPADMLITVDAGNLWHAAREGVLQAVNSPELNKNIPEHLRDPEGNWFGLSIRARTIVYNIDKVQPEQLDSYEDLAISQWKNRLLLRTSKKVYNQSLVAMLIVEHGVEKTSEIVKGWVGNLAAPPFSSDTKVLEAIAAGLGDVGIVNTYYYGRLIKENPDLPLAIFWPNQKGSGVHVNISGAGVTRHAKNRDEAVRFLEWLSSPDAQNLFADVNMEYPVNPMVKTNPVVASWGTFKQNTINLEKAGELQGEAIKLMDRVGYK